MKDLPKKYWALGGIIVFILLLLFLARSFSDFVQKREGYSFTYTTDSSTLVLHDYGARLWLGPPGWRFFTMGNSPTDYVSDIGTWDNPLYDGVVGIPWFSYPDLELVPEAHFAMVSPERWQEITRVTGDELNQFGYLAQFPRFVDLLRELEVVVLQKQKGQSLDEFLRAADARVLTHAEQAYQDGNAAESVVEDARKGFFGNFQIREAKVLSGGVESLWLSERTTPPSLDAEEFLMFACPAGSHVIVIYPGPYGNNDAAAGDIDFGYSELLISIREGAQFQRSFCLEKI